MKFRYVVTEVYEVDLATDLLPIELEDWSHCHCHPNCTDPENWKDCQCPPCECEPHIAPEAMISHIRSEHSTPEDWAKDWNMLDEGVIERRIHEIEVDGLPLAWSKQLA